MSLITIIKSLLPTRTKTLQHTLSLKSSTFGKSDIYNLIKSYQKQINTLESDMKWRKEFMEKDQLKIEIFSRLINSLKQMPTKD